MTIQGEDIQVRFNLTTDGTTPILPSTLNAYAINVYYLNEFGDKSLLATYKSTNTGLYDIVVFNNTLGQVDIIINRELTKTISKGKVYGEVFAQSTASSEFILSLSRSGASSIYLFDIDTSANYSAL